MLDADDRQSRDWDGVKAVFRPSVRYSGVRNGLANPDVIERGFFASESESNETISEDAIRYELSRILESSIFVQSNRLGRFLRFTVEKTLAGEGEMIKEYLIGTEVYDRPTSYRPNEDSIVRSEARRLRSKLKEYYESFGRNDPLFICYRPGSYVPMFRNQHRRENFTATEATTRHCFTGGDGIRIAVLPFLDASGSASSGVCAQLITDDLIHELVRTDGIRVTAACSVAPLVAKAMDIRSLARKLDVQIVLEGTVREDNNLLRITSRVVNAADGFQIWSERFETEADPQNLFEVSERIASALISRIRTEQSLIRKQKASTGASMLSVYPLVLAADVAHTNRVSILGELVASISHELAQPITVTTAHAKASLRWLQRDPPDLTEVRKGTERIIEAGTLASEIISRLRSLYKKTPPHRESVDLDEIIGEMILLLRSEANEYAVSIRTNLAADLPKITADRVQLQQVLINLMLNGIEAMRETGGVLTVKTGRGGDGQVLISVSDTGVGLPAGRADEIFNAFFTTKAQGSGMGLAISRSIVESHDGSLWATSHDGRGATFHFTLPTAVVECRQNVRFASSSSNDLRP